jgi:O-antigen/teichoic acid export membrane protein
VEGAVKPADHDKVGGGAQGRSGLRRVAENVSWLIGERSLLLVLNFIVSVWFINYLGPSSYGKYAYAVSFATLFASLATLGLNNIVIRELASSKGAHGEILGTAFVMRIGSSVMTFGLIAIAIFLVTDDPTTRLLVLVVAISVLADPTQVVDLWFQSRIESKYVVWVRVGVSLASILAKVALIVLRMPLIAFAWLYAAQALAMGLAFVVVFALRRPTGLRLRRSAVRAAGLLRDSWPLIVTGLSATVYMKIDRIMLGQMLGDHDVGIYSTAATISEVWNMFPVILATSLFPVVVRSRESSNEDLYARRMQALYDVMALGAYAVAIPMSLLAHWLIDLLFPSEFADSAGILQVHIWSLLFVALGVSRSRYLVAENLIRFSMWAALAGGALNVLFNWFLIPRAGGVGAAWATLIAYGMAAYLSGLFVPRLRATTVQMTRALLAPLRPKAAAREIREFL